MVGKSTRRWLCFRRSPPRPAGFRLAHFTWGCIVTSCAMLAPAWVTSSGGDRCLVHSGCSAATPAPPLGWLLPDILFSVAIHRTPRPARDGGLSFGSAQPWLTSPFPQGSCHGRASSPTANDCGSQCEPSPPVHVGRRTTRRCSRATSNPGGSRPPRKASRGNTGLKINYYAMCNLQGFQKHGPTPVGGVHPSNVREPIPASAASEPRSPATSSRASGSLTAFETSGGSRGSRVAADDYSRKWRARIA